VFLTSPSAVALGRRPPDANGGRSRRRCAMMAKPARKEELDVRLQHRLDGHDPCAEVGWRDQARPQPLAGDRNGPAGIG